MKFLGFLVTGSFNIPIYSTERTVRQLFNQNSEISFLKRAHFSYRGFFDSYYRI